MFTDLREFVECLEKSGELIRVGQELSPQYEIPEAIRYAARHSGQAILFERVEGYDIPVVGNLLGTRKRFALALSTDEARSGEEYLVRKKTLIKPRIVDKAPVKEVILDKEINILKTIPVLTHNEKDAGPYFTTAITIAKDPVTGIRGMGLHRIQVKDKDTLGILLASPPLSLFLKKAQERDEPLEIAIACGMDPLTFFSAVIWAPEGIDKFDIAGALAQRPIELVKCQSVDLEVPARAEFVMEGSIIPHKREVEGPFGESNGYYFTFKSPVARIKVITHHHKPLYHALMTFSGEESVLMGISWEMDNLEAIQRIFPQVKRIHLRNLAQVAIVQIEKNSEEDGNQVIKHILSSQPFIKYVVLVDTDIDPYDLQEIEWALTTRLKPETGVSVIPDMVGVSMEPYREEKELPSDFSLLMTKTIKIGLDATKPLEGIERFERIAVPPEVSNKISKIMEKL